MMVPYDGPRVTDELIHRLEGEEIAFTQGWLEGAMARPGNPRGLRIDRFGDVMAPLAANAPELDFMNRVAGLTPQNVDVLPRVLSLYRATGIRPWFEIAPYSRPGDPVGVALASAGAVPEWHSTLLYAPAAVATMQSGPAGGPSTPVSVRRVEAEEISRFAEILLRGWEVPDDELADAVEDHGHWHGVPGWHLYVAEVEGEAAAAAVLQVRGGVGYLASASTLPAQRNKGCQSALIRRRIVDAAAQGCDILCGQALFGSTSQQNMERAGLRPACTLTTWRLGAATSDLGAAAG